MFCSLVDCPLVSQQSVYCFGREMEPYSVEEYLPYEHWKCQTEGPILARRLAEIFKAEGFPLHDDEGDSIECAWHEQIYKPMLAEEKKRADEGWYRSEFTNEQLEMIASGLETFIEELQKYGNRPGDEHLIAILVDYARSVREVLMGQK